MPRPKPRWRDHLLDVACEYCEYCEAQIGERCRTKGADGSAVYASRPHQQRIRAAILYVNRQA